MKPLLRIALSITFLICIEPVKAAEPPITSILLCGDSVLACSQHGLGIFDPSSLQRTRTIQLPFASPHDLKLSPNAARLAIAGGSPASSGQVQIVEFPSLAPVSVFGNHEDVVTSVCWMNDDTLAMASHDGTVSIWNVDEALQRTALVGHSRGVLAVISLGDAGETLVTAGIDRSLKVWDCRTGEVIRSLAIHTQQVNGLAVRPMTPSLAAVPPMVASASDDRTIRFWQPTIGRMVRFARLKSKPLDLAWLPDGTRVIASCSDGNLYSIDPETVAISGPVRVSDGWNHSLAVGTHSQVVFVGDQGTLRRVAIQEILK